MSIFDARGRLIFTAVIAVLASSGVLAADDIGLQQKINACHAISDRDTRIACYDRLAEPPSSMLPMSANPQPSPASGSPSLAVSRVQPTSGVAQAAPAPTPNVALQSPAPQPLTALQTSESLRGDTDEIVIAVSSATLVGKKLSFITNDGITWDQTDERPLRQMPAPGDLVNISRGYLGYMCKFSKHEKFRCKPPYGLNGKMHLQ